MNSGSPNSNAVGARPVEFLYLDRARLISYASQLGGGLTLLRHLREVSQAGSQTIPASEEREESHGRRTTVGARGGAYVMEGHADHERESSETMRQRGGGSAVFEAAGTLIDESKIEHDNLMLLVEKNLEDQGLLRDFAGDSSQGGLYRFHGPLTFFDWQMVTAALRQWEYFLALSKLSSDTTGAGAAALTPEFAQALAGLLDVFSFGEMQASMTCAGQSIVAPLSPVPLQMTREQLRLAYAMQDIPILATMIAFVPRKTNDRHEQLGVAGQVKLGQVATALIGKVDLTVIPISIYIPL